MRLNFEIVQRGVIRSCIEVFTLNKAVVLLICKRRNRCVEIIRRILGNVFLIPDVRLTGKHVSIVYGTFIFDDTGYDRSNRVIRTVCRGCQTDLFKITGNRNIAAFLQFAQGAEPDKIVRSIGKHIVIIAFFIGTKTFVIPTGLIGFCAPIDVADRCLERRYNTRSCCREVCYALRFKERIVKLHHITHSNSGLGSFRTVA